jgi:hypothetical protein
MPGSGVKNADENAIVMRVSFRSIQSVKNVVMRVRSFMYGVWDRQRKKFSLLDTDEFERDRNV